MRMVTAHICCQLQSHDIHIISQLYQLVERYHSVNNQWRESCIIGLHDLHQKRLGTDENTHISTERELHCNLNTGRFGS